MAQHPVGVASDVGVAGVERDIPEAGTAAQVGCRIHRHLVDRDQRVIEHEHLRARRGEHQVGCRYVAEREVRVGAEGCRCGIRADVLDDVGDLDAVGSERVRDCRVELERVAALGKDCGREREPVAGLLGHRVRHEAQQPVRCAPDRRVGDPQLVGGAVVAPLAIADAVRPRHEHGSGCRGRRHPLRVRCDEVYAIDGEPADRRTHLGEVRGHATVGTREVELLPGGVVADVGHGSSSAGVVPMLEAVGDASDLACRGCRGAGVSQGEPVRWIGRLWTLPCMASGFVSPWGRW